jgi:hypothetical protein
MDEAKQILSRLARGSDPNVRIKAIESLAKIERDERELEARQQEGGTDLYGEIREIAKISPELAEAYAKEKGVVWIGFPKRPTCVVCGAICFSIPSHLPATLGSHTSNPVMFPPGWGRL